MAKLGNVQRLRVLKETDAGAYLDGGALGEILLPGRYLPRRRPLPAEFEIFLYRDSEDRLVATTERPRAMVGEFACLRVKDFVEGVGAFLDWGLSKDLLLPMSEQPVDVRVGDSIAVFVEIDPATDRLIASARLKHRICTDTEGLAEGMAVDLLLAEETPMGFNAIINQKWMGLLYRSDASATLMVGSTTRAFVKAIREDGKIDLTLEEPGYGRTEGIGERILAALVEAGGHLDLDDATPPETIRSEFGVSKRAFKQALGRLYRERKITMGNPGIDLVGGGPELSEDRP